MSALGVLSGPRTDILCYLSQEHAILLGFLLDVKLGTSWEVSLLLVLARTRRDKGGMTLLATTGLELRI